MLKTYLRGCHCGAVRFEADIDLAAGTGKCNARWADIPQAGGKYITVNVACLDDVNIDEMVTAPITYFDGRANNWWARPAEIRHL